mmetsp:Transcript_101972/g.172797  ORF Transcript_101972/g.172797 Transcript_101972/m.172797 type:complete len:91 (+) Transcript_101972:226-498(+)
MHTAARNTQQRIGNWTAARVNRLHKFGLWQCMVLCATSLSSVPLLMHLPMGKLYSCFFDLVHCNNCSEEECPVTERSAAHSCTPTLEALK